MRFGWCKRCSAAAAAMAASCCLLAAGPAGARAAEAGRDLDAAFSQALAEADRCLAQLRELRVLAGRKADRVDGVAKFARAVLGDVDRALGAELARIEPFDPNADPVRPPREKPSPGRLIRVRRCRAMLLRGQVSLAAAEALPAAHSARKKHLADAIEAFQWLRIEYRGLPLGMMGYIGEAKARRLLGEAKSALAVLDPVLGLPPRSKDPAAVELRLAAMLEKLRTTRLIDAQKALAEARRWAGSRELADRPRWRGRAEWVLATLLADQLTAAKATTGPARAIDEAAALCRRPTVIAVAPAFDRLELLWRLDAAAGGRCMRPDELLRWAELLAAASRPEAERIYARLWSSPGRNMPADAMLTYATLLWRKGESASAANVCDEFISRHAPAHARLASAAQLRAAALLHAYAAAGGAKIHPAARARVLDALAVAVEANLPADVRRDALRQWVTVRMHGGGNCQEMLRRHRDLVAGDAFLLYVGAAERWQTLAGRMTAGAVEPKQAAKDAAQIAATLGEARKYGELSKRGELAANSALLRARLLAGKPLRDARAALEALNGQWKLLQSQQATAMPAAWLRVELMMQLGLLDGASEALAEVRKSGAASPTDVALRLAEMLANRFEDTPLAEAGKLQRRVLVLCNETLAQSVADRDEYYRRARRVGAVMLKVHAFADTEFFFTRLLAEPGNIPDRSVVLDATIMLAEALRRNDKPAEGLDRLARLAEAHPDSAELFLAVGRCELALLRPKAAVIAVRKARKLTERGSVDWCRMTVALAEALRAAEHAAAAEDVLRVAQALYPNFGNAELKARLIRLRRSLAASGGVARKGQ